MMTKRWMTMTAVVVLTASTALTACAPLLVGGAVGTGVVVATDRRTTGMQVEDQGIELRARRAVREALGDRGRVIINSFNRRVLITGTVPTQTDKALVARLVAQVENVREIVDELGVMGDPALSVRSSDTLITTRVKAAFIDAKDLSANAISVTTERGVVYMMGRVTQREANRAADMARTVPGVQQVVRVFEVISEEELARIQPPRQPAQPAASQPAAR
jgi:osmotically-inducible protein OsmY